jgi:error-prone DNA polymerase
MSGSRYTELQVTTHFSFLRGASSCEELFATAAVMGVEALAVVDRNSLAGVVRAHEAAKTTGVRLVVGCRLDLTEGYSVLVYPTDRPAYSRLCRLLSLGKKRAGKARCELGWPDLVAYREGLIAVLVPDEADVRRDGGGFSMSVSCTLAFGSGGRAPVVRQRMGSSAHAGLC